MNTVGCCGTTYSTASGVRPSPRSPPAHCEALLTALVRQASRQGDRKPLKPGTVKHVWDVLRYALHHGAIVKNPTDRVDFSASRATGDHARFEHHPLTATELGAVSAALLVHVPGLPAYPAYAVMVEFMAYTGLCAAEVSGLEVGDLVFAPGPRCSVTSAAPKAARTASGSSARSRARSRKKSRRAVPLPPWLTTKLADYLADDHLRMNEPTAPLWPSRNNGGGYRAKGERYEVPLDWSQPLAMGAFYETILKPALEAVGLPGSRPAPGGLPAIHGVRLHDLRHTFAVLQLSAGTHFMQVSKWLGHSTFTLTLDTYGDYIPAEQDGGALNMLPEPPAPAPRTEAVGNVVIHFGRATGLNESECRGEV